MGSAEAEAAEQLGPNRPKANKKRGHDARRIRRRPGLRCNRGRIGRRLTNSEGTRAVGSAIAKGAKQLGP